MQNMTKRTAKTLYVEKIVRPEKKIPGVRIAGCDGLRKILHHIHPFGDGNGRTSRLLTDYIQLYHDEPLVKIFTEDRAIYIDALNETEEKEDSEIFGNFICEQQIKFYEAEIEKYKKMLE